jgi:hypothetical protein
MDIIIIVYKKYKKIQTKNLFPTGRTGQTGFFEYFGLYFFEIYIMMAIRVCIHFIQNLMLNSNLKSDIQKNI